MSRPDPDACRAWQLLVKFFYAQRDHLPSATDELGLSAAQCHVLHLIEPDHPLPMGRLATTLACDPANVTGLVDRLETRGFVRRKPSKEDRRVKVLELTAAGGQLRAQLLKRIAAGRHPLRRLSPAQTRSLVRILEVLMEQDG